MGLRWAKPCAKKPKTSESMKKEKRWYAVYTRSRWEKKIAETLLKSGIQAYCPINRVEHRWSDRIKLVEEPLFRNYVFVRICDKELVPVLSTSGVIHFVTNMGKPALVQDAEIEAIRDMLNEYVNVQVKRAEVHRNDLVHIISGPLQSHEGVIVAEKRNTVKVMLPTLGYMMYVEVGKENLRLVKRAV